MKSVVGLLNWKARDWEQCLLVGVHKIVQIVHPHKKILSYLLIEQDPSPVKNISTICVHNGICANIYGFRQNPCSTREYNHACFTMYNSLPRLTNLFASALQNSQPRKKLTKTTFFLAPLCGSSRPRDAFGFVEVLRAVYRSLRTSQLDVAPRIEVIKVSEASGWDDRYGAMRGGSGG